jgi:hypothetical protein
MRDYVEATTCANPTAVVPFAVILRGFRATLPEAERESWTRSRAIVELTKAGYTLAVDGRHQTVLVGRSTRPAKRLVVQDGRLLKVRE